jgi:hypothetical protein
VLSPLVGVMAPDVDVVAPVVLEVRILAFGEEERVEDCDWGGRDASGFLPRVPRPAPCDGDDPLDPRDIDRRGVSFCAFCCRLPPGASLLVSLPLLAFLRVICGCWAAMAAAAAPASPARPLKEDRLGLFAEGAPFALSARPLAGT